MIPPGKRSATALSPDSIGALIAQQVEAGVEATEAASGVPQHINTEQLFRSGRISTPDAQQRLTGAYLMFAVTQPPPVDVPEAAREALVESTRRQHVMYLKMVAKVVNPDMPLDRALVSALQLLAHSKGWKQSTQMKAAAALQGAFKILPLYFANTASVLLKEYPVWRMSLVTFGHRAKQELPDQPKAATWEQVSNAISECKNDAQAMVMLIGWLTASRLGCVRQLSKGDVKWSAKHTLVRFAKGKGARIRGPYTVHAQPIPTEFKERWSRYVEDRQTALFPNHVTGKSLKDALRRIDPSLEQRSIRRGALQAMAMCGVDEETLMRYSGHTQVSTLRRYLNWNAVNSKVQKEMTEAGKALVRKAASPRK
jgi:integrase